MAMAEVAIAEVWGRLALLAGVWISIRSDWGFYPIIAAVSLGSLVNFSILYFKSKKYVAYKWRLDREVLKEIWNTSWPLAITISLTLIYFRADTIVLSLVRSPEEVGIYGAAYKVLEILIQFPYLFLGLILPLLTEFFLTSRPLYDKIFHKAFDFLAIIAVPMVAATWLLSGKIMELVAGPDFIIAAAPLNILIIAAGLIYFGALAGYAIVAAGLQKKMIGFYIFDAVFSLTTYLIFIPLYGYFAAAILTVITETIIALSAFWILYRRLNLLPKLVVFLKSILAATIMCAVLWLLISQSLITLVFIGLIVYFVALHLLKGIDKEMIGELVKIK
jgi:O-antigen/teichoic acid export membrane protein